MRFSTFKINELQAIFAQQKTVPPQSFDYNKCF
jgi:hypothetical protein